MKHSYLLAGIKLSHLLRLIKNNGLSLHLRYLLRFLFLFQSGIWSTLFSSIEKKRFGKAVTDYQLPDDPVFIIGHWRTGSTFLHQLFNLDERFAAPTVFQVSVPECFMVSRQYYKPVMSRMLDTVRPMDQVKLGFDEPQEDEYALLKMGASSPLEKLIFPNDKAYFLSGISTFDPDTIQREDWIRSFTLFYKKLAMQSGKRIVFKNPFHSLRIDLLKQLFPNAFFIHIYRNPFVVIPSTQRMWSIVGKHNCLKRYTSDPPLADVTDVYKTTMENIRKSLNSLPENRYVEIRFEVFEIDPIKGLKTIYKGMGIPFSSIQEQAVTDFLSKNMDYRKNRYVLSEKEVSIITQKLHQELEHKGYTNPN